MFRSSRIIHEKLKLACAHTYTRSPFSTPCNLLFNYLETSSPLQCTACATFFQIINKNRFTSNGPECLCKMKSLLAYLYHWGAANHLCLSSRALRTLARSSALIWSEIIICSTTWWAMPGRVFWSRSSSTAPANTQARWAQSSMNQTGDFQAYSLHKRTRSLTLPWEMVLLSSSKLRKDSEATWGFPQRSVSSSTSSSNLIQRAVSFHCSSWFLSIVSSFSSTNTWGDLHAYGPHVITCTFVPNTQKTVSKALWLVSLSNFSHFCFVPHFICPWSFSLWPAFNLKCHAWGCLHTWRRKELWWWMKKPIIHFSVLKEAQNKARIHKWQQENLTNVGANISDSSCFDSYVHISAQNVRNEEGKI